MIPVVALVEGVVHAVNAERPELVRAATLKKLPVAWNNRPICGGHPFEGGTQVSANDPHILERDAFGFIANADVPEDRLILEAWADPSLVRVGTVAERVMRRLQAGEPNEVSVGAYITLEEKEGVWKDGRKYFAEWVDLSPDHLAFLDDDEIGACSIADGCGALRSNSRHIYLVTAKGLEPVQEESMNKCAKCGKDYEGTACPCATSATPPVPLTLRQRVIFETSASDDLTSSDLSNGLDRALRAIEPGYQGVLDILLNQKKVVYVVAPEDTWKLLQRSYAVDDGGNVTIANDAEEVRMVNRYEPVAEGRAAASRAASGCGCNNPNKGEADMNRDERIAALITKGTYKDADKTWLTAMPDAAFDTLAKSHEAPPAATPPPAPAPAPATAAAAAATTPPANIGGASAQTAEQFFAAVGDPLLRESLQDGYRVSQERRAALITALKGTGRCQYSDEELSAKTLGELEKLSQLASVPAPAILTANFGGRGIPPASNKTTQTIDDPPSLTDAIRTAAAGKTKSA